MYIVFTERPERLSKTNQQQKRSLKYLSHFTRNKRTAKSPDELKCEEVLFQSEYHQHQGSHFIINCVRQTGLRKQGIITGLNKTDCTQRINLHNGYFLVFIHFAFSYSMLLILKVENED